MAASDVLFSICGTNWFPKHVMAEHTHLSVEKQNHPHLPYHVVPVSTSGHSMPASRAMLVPFVSWYQSAKLAFENKIGCKDVCSAALSQNQEISRCIGSPRNPTQSFILMGTVCPPCLPRFPRAMRLCLLARQPQSLKLTSSMVSNVWYFLRPRMVAWNDPCMTGYTA